MRGSTEKRIEYTSGIRSFTLKQISNATKAYAEAPWKVDGQELTKSQQVTVVAHVIREDLRDDMKVVYRLDDGTAQLSAWRTLPSGDGGLERPEDQLLAADELCYVRVLGFITRISPTSTIPSISVQGIQKVTDVYEILHHYMEAMVAASASQRGWPSPEVVKRARAEGAKEYAANVLREEPVPSSSQYTASQYPATQYSATQYASFYPDTPPTTPRGAALSPNRTFSPSSTRATPQREASPLQTRSTSQRSGGNDAPSTPQRTPSRYPQPVSASLSRTASGHTRPQPSVAAEATSSTSPFVTRAPHTPARALAPTQSASATPSATPTRTPGVPVGYRTPPAQTQDSLRIGRDPLAHLTGFQRQVMLAIMNSPEGNSPKGVHVTVIAKGMRASNPDNILPRDVATAFDELADRNLIEPTDGTCLFYRVVGTGNGYALPKDT